MATFYQYNSFLVSMKYLKTSVKTIRTKKYFLLIG